MTSTPIDLLLIQPGGRSAVYQSLGSSLTAVEPPVWASLMATYVRRQGRGVALLDANVEDLTPDQVAARVEDIRPRLVAVVTYGHQPSASTQTMPAAGAICRAIKALTPAQPVVMAGGHVAALPTRTLDEEACDFVLHDEGLVSLDALTEVAGSRDEAVLARVPGLGWRDLEGHVRLNPAAPLVTDLDAQVPGMAWDLIDVPKYRAHNWHAFGFPSRQPYVSLYTTLGCPYKCTFCCIQAPFKGGEAAAGMPASVNSYRFWSPARIVDDLTMLVERHGVRHVKIADEMFVLNRAHVLEVCRLIIERRLDLNIRAYARIDTVKPDMLDTLKRAGVNWLAFGIEAADERVQTDVGKRFTPTSIRQVVGQVHEAGISIIGNYIFGLPEDDRQTMQATLDLALELNCEFANFYTAMAYPGSALYQQAGAKGWALPDSWSGYSQHASNTRPLPTNHLSAAEVLAFRDEAFLTYHRAPAYLALVERKFGATTRAEVEAMTAHHLHREIVEASAASMAPALTAAVAPSAA
jgi:anaerobic magnesium-protoporphyrin IX monomethyl ester cyclase